MISLRRVALSVGLAAVAVALSAVACGGADLGPAGPDDVEARGERRDYDDSREDEPGANWRWQGRRQDCFYVHDNECFSDRSEACLAAGCDENTCILDDSAPANVSCPDE